MAIVGLILLLPIFALASSVSDVYTSENFETSYHDRPLSFDEDEFGNFRGVTETGKVFTQTYVAIAIPNRLQKFSIDDVSFYISDRGVIEAENDIEALSVYLSLLS